MGVNVVKIITIKNSLFLMFILQNINTDIENVLENSSIKYL